MSLSAHHHYLEEIDAFFNSIDHNEGEKHYAIILACFLQDEGIET